MNSKELKTKVLYHFRFKRRYLYCATEAGRFRSDVLVSNKKEIIECEIKTNKRDLIQDLSKPKHLIYTSPAPAYKPYVPNKFYFCVPEKLVPIALNQTKSWFTIKYGVLLVYDIPLSNKRKVKYCKIVKRARLLQSSFNPKLHKQILMRMGSELIRTRLKEYYVNTRY